MKAIILAAGMGQRLGRYTSDRPKGMVELFGKPLLAHQLERLSAAGVGDIVIVRGYKAEKVDFAGVRYYQNDLYESTNMVHTLFCAEDELRGDILVMYSDIVYEPRLLDSMLQSPADIGVLVDSDFGEYWSARNGVEGADNESLCIDGRGAIIEIGAPNPAPDKVQARYIGMLKFSGAGIDALRRIYRAEAQRTRGSEGKWYHSKSFANAYMTDLLQCAIDAGEMVSAIDVKRGWLEVDSVSDLEVYLDWQRSGTLGRFISMDCCV